MSLLTSWRSCLGCEQGLSIDSRLFCVCGVRARVCVRRCDTVILWATGHASHASVLHACDPRHARSCTMTSGYPPNRRQRRRRRRAVAGAGAAPLR
jgi:hypothetical protein